MPDREIDAMREVTRMLRILNSRKATALKRKLLEEDRRSHAETRRWLGSPQKRAFDKLHAERDAEALFWARGLEPKGGHLNSNPFKGLR